MQVDPKEAELKNTELLEKKLQKELFKIAKRSVSSISNRHVRMRLVATLTKLIVCQKKLKTLSSED